jgi:hypothetical protein
MAFWGTIGAGALFDSIKSKIKDKQIWEPYGALRFVVRPDDILRMAKHSRAGSNVKGGKAAAQAVKTLDIASSPAHDSIHPGNVRI